MYDQFYQFQGRPFQLTPDPHFYFESATHRKALSYLGYGLAQGEGFIVITGEIGAGKTTLVGHVMNSIDPARLTAIKIVSTQVQGDDLLHLVAQGFGIEAEHLAKAELLQRIEWFLHDQARKGLRTLLIVDEAQNLPHSSVEELRMLSNFQLGGQALLQIFLLGQPEFRDIMNAPEMEQLRQRVIATHHLEPMRADEIQPYVEHRLNLVGWHDDPHFTEEAYAAVYDATNGVPRRVNALMSRVLLLGAVDHLHEIDGGTVEAVVADMQGEHPRKSEKTAPEAPVQSFAASGEAAPSVAPHSGEQPQGFAAVADSVVEAAETSVPAISHEEVAALRAELEALRQMVSEGSSADADAQGITPEISGRLDAIETRLASMEARGEEQEAALRRILSLLIDWVEHDEKSVRAA